MKRVAYIVAVLCICILATSCKGKGIVETSNQEKRIVAGTVSAVQYLDALDLNVVGIPTTEKNLPERYKNAQKIGMPMAPNAEMILACKPDIFITDINLKANVEEMFYGQDIELIFLDNNSFGSIENNINLLAKKLDVTKKAKEVIETIHNKNQEAMKMTQGKKQPTVAIIFGTSVAFMLSTDASFAGDIVNRLGAKNITDDLKGNEPYVAFDMEQLAKSNPDVILRLSHADLTETKKAFDAEFKKPFWQEIKAVQTNRVYDLDPFYFGVTANYDSIEAIEILAEMLYQK